MVKGTEINFSSMRQEGNEKSIVQKEMIADNDYFNINAREVILTFINFLRDHHIGFNEITNELISISANIRSNLFLMTEPDIRNTSEYALYSINKENFEKRFNEDEVFRFTVFNICSSILTNYGFDMQYEEEPQD